jgi:Protein of unknown function (DUF3631)
VGAEAEEVFMALGGQLNPAELLDQVANALRWWMKFPCTEAADAAALYVAASWCAPSLTFAPRLRVKSPQKQCGKTRLMELLGHLVRNPMMTSNISAAALVRSITEDDPPTIMLDEADATFGRGLKGDERAEHLRGILNAGFNRGAPYIRWNAAAREREECPTFAMAFIAGIGDLPDTIESRSVPITLTRKTRAETCNLTGRHGPCAKVHKFRPRRDRPALDTLRDQLAGCFTPERADRVGAAEPDMPPGLSDRAEDVFEALIAVADLAGGTWPQRARNAALRLMADASGGSGEGDDASGRTDSIRLLINLRQIFVETGEDFTGTRDLIVALCDIEEAPWNTFDHGRGISPHGIAELLRAYGITPRQKKTPPNTVTRGYFRADFEDAWSRYLPDLLGDPADAGSPYGVVPATPATAGTRRSETWATDTGNGPDVTRYPLPSPDLRGNGVATVAGNTPHPDFAALYAIADRQIMQNPDADDDY